MTEFQRGDIVILKSPDECDEHGYQAFIKCGSEMAVPGMVLEVLETWRGESGPQAYCHHGVKRGNFPFSWLKMFKSYQEQLAPFGFVGEEAGSVHAEAVGLNLRGTQTGRLSSTERMKDRSVDEEYVKAHADHDEIMKKVRAAKETVPTPGEDARDSGLSDKDLKPGDIVMLRTLALTGPYKDQIHIHNRGLQESDHGTVTQVGRLSRGSPVVDVFWHGLGLEIECSPLRLDLKLRPSVYDPAVGPKIGRFVVQERQPEPLGFFALYSLAHQPYSPAEIERAHWTIKNAKMNVRYAEATNNLEVEAYLRGQRQGVLLSLSAMRRQLVGGGLARLEQAGKEARDVLEKAGLQQIEELHEAISEYLARGEEPKPVFQKKRPSVAHDVEVEAGEEIHYPKPEKSSTADNPSTKRATTGLPELDDVIGHGFPPGALANPLPYAMHRRLIQVGDEVALVRDDAIPGMQGKYGESIGIRLGSTGKVIELKQSAHDGMVADVLWNTGKDTTYVMPARPWRLSLILDPEEKK